MFYFNGDSFTYGSELLNLSDRYSDIVSKNFKMTCLNQSLGGASNQKIFRETMQAIATYDDIKLVSVMWTEFFRFEHFIKDAGKYGSGHDGWRRVNANRLFHNKKDDFNNFRMKNVNRALGMYATEVRTDEHMIVEFLNMVLQLQTLCKARNIKLINSFAFGEGILAKNYTFLTSCPIYKLIDMSLWLTNDPYWSMSRYNADLNLPHGKEGHPLSKGHKETAKLFVKKING
jgi:hypothetical protein